MDPLENPYRPGAGTPPPALIGRDELINRFAVTVRRAVDGRPTTSLMPIGLRGVGKTVLLNRFGEIADQEGLRVAFIEAPETGDFRTLLAVRLRKLLLQLDRSGATRAVMKALRVLKTFTIQLPRGRGSRLTLTPCQEKRTRASLPTTSPTSSLPWAKPLRRSERASCSRSTRCSTSAPMSSRP